MTRDGGQHLEQSHKECSRPSADAEYQWHRRLEIRGRPGFTSPSTGILTTITTRTFSSAKITGRTGGRLPRVCRKLPCIASASILRRPISGRRDGDGRLRDVRSRRRTGRRSTPIFRPFRFTIFSSSRARTRWCSARTAAASGCWIMIEPLAAITPEIDGQGISVSRSAGSSPSSLQRPVLVRLRRILRAESAGGRDRYLFASERDDGRRADHDYGCGRQDHSYVARTGAGRIESRLLGSARVAADCERTPTPIARCITTGGGRGDAGSGCASCIARNSALGADAEWGRRRRGPGRPRTGSGCVARPLYSLARLA